MFWMDVLFELLVFLLTSLLGIPLESMSQQLAGG